jgi:hypothetical protein
MRLHAYNQPIPSTRVASIGSWLFKMDEQGILDPQPTKQQLAAGIGVFTKFIDVPDAPVAPTPLAEDFKLTPSAPTSAAIDPLQALFGAAIEEDDEQPPVAAPLPLIEVSLPKPTPEAPPTDPDASYASMTLAELKLFATEMGISFPSNITKTKLIDLLSQE